MEVNSLDVQTTSPNHNCKEGMCMSEENLNVDVLVMASPLVVSFRQFSFSLSSQLPLLLPFFFFLPLRLFSSLAPLAFAPIVR